MDEQLGKKGTAGRTRLRIVERRLKSFYDPKKQELERRQVEASRDFHMEHWLSLAEAVIQRDHQKFFYGALSPNLKATIADYPSDDFPPEMQQTILKDLAFMEGHVEAFRQVSRILKEARKQTPEGLK